jgi:uncharacterized protein YkwD
LKAALSLLLAALLWGNAHASVLDTVNNARAHACHAPSLGPVLQDSPALQQAARRLAGGAPLQDALASAGYVAIQSAALHLSGDLSDAQIARMLSANDCRTLTDPKFRDMGVERRGRDLWIVLGAPLTLPSVADSAAVIQSLFERVNAARAAGHRCGGKYFAPVPALTLTAVLSDAARAHARDMTATGYFDHRGRDGSTPASRIERAGFAEHRIVGENIAAGVMTAAEVTDGWLASPAHCENIMDGRFTHIGIAYAENLRSAEHMYWTEDFAARR